MLTGRTGHILLKLLLSTGLFLVAGRNSVQGQSTPIYAQYIGPEPANTGGNNGAVGAAGTLGSLGSPLGTHFINNPTYINDTNYANFVGLTAQSGANGTGLGAGYGKLSTSYINLNFSGAVTPVSGTPIVIKLQAGSIGLVSIQAYTGTTPVGSSKAFSALATNGPDEYVFLAPGNCNNIRITASTTDLSLLGGTASNYANIYYAYILDPTCVPANYTNTSMTTVLDLGSSFSNVTNAIDGNPGTFSSFSVGLGVGTTLYQNIYFSQLSAASDAATIRLSIPPSALAAGVLGSINLKAYNGNTFVGGTSFQALLQGTDVLTILNTGGISSFSFAPGAAFNRIEVSMSSLLSLATSMNLYEVQSTPPKPTFSSPSAKDIIVCLGSNAVFTSTPTSGNELRWYTSATGGTALTGNTFTPTPAPTTNTTYYVAMGKPGCTTESERVPVTATIKPLPHLPAITPSINQ